MDGPECPLCDFHWESEQDLRDHLKRKLAKSEEARKLQESLLSKGAILGAHVARVLGLLAPVHRLAGGEDDKALPRLLALWESDLEALSAKLTTAEGIVELKDRLRENWLGIPETLANKLRHLTQKVEAKPDQSAALDAQTFLTTAQLRLGDYRESMRRNRVAEMAATAGKLVYDTYCGVLEDELNTLYEDVQEDFSEFYRAINEEDENKFTAKLTPTEGRLDFDVNFYDRGLFPPGAYHSEGHQDGMGVCLYLALMKRLFGDRFSLALLDDVVMSVDTGHRYQFCKLLKTHFPQTQFILTTHDRLWAEQMKSAGLVASKTSVAFHSWTVDTGPMVESTEEIWQEIASALSKGRVEAAAMALRHHLEYASFHLADLLGAMPRFRADGNYELGELLPSVLSRMKSLCAKAAAAAQSWGDNAGKEAALGRKDVLSTCNGATSVEQWAVNKAVHYNEWANFGRKDFQPVVVAFRELLECFGCDRCKSWLYVTPRMNPESLRCNCNAISLNLKPKPN